MRTSTLLYVFGFATLTFAHPGPPKLSERHDVVPTPYQGNSKWKYQGCYGETPGNQALKQLFTDDHMTAEKCFSYCDKYQYAWLEYSRYVSCTLDSGIYFHRVEY